MANAIKDILESLTPEKLDSMTLNERLKVQELVQQLKVRRTEYPILDFELHDYQQEIIDALTKRNPDGTPYYKYVIMMGGNGAGKTIVGGYAMICKLLGHDTKKYGLPFMGVSRMNKVVTATGNQIKENIEPYIFGSGTDQDLIKVPPCEITKSGIKREKGILKEAHLKNGVTLYTGTYDQGMTRLQGGTPSFLWLDEIPERWADFDELTKRTRDEYGQFLITFTPTNYNQKIYDWIHKVPTEEETKLYGEGRRYFIQVDALRNTKANHSHMIGKSEEDLMIVRFGQFVPPEGLVFKSFKRTENVIEHFHPKKMEGNVRYYGALDFGVKHPMAFLFIAVDGDNNVYVFDMIHQKNMLLKDLILEVNKKKLEYGIDFEWIVADNGDLRARTELKEMGMRTISADKSSKGESQMSNRRTGIMKLNQMFNTQELTISDKCRPLIQELETHHYKAKGVDGTVNKTDDDAIDALRYFIFNYRVKDELRDMKKLRKKMKRRQKTKRY